MINQTSEQNIAALVNDFDVLCRFIVETDPVISKKTGALGKKDLFALNLLLVNQKEVSAPKYQQPFYLAIDLLMNLAAAGKLFVKRSDEKGVVRLAVTERKDQFDTLNLFEKYFFLFETFWTRYDFETSGHKWRINGVDVLVQSIARANEGETLARTDPRFIEIGWVLDFEATLIHLFALFGICCAVPFLPDDATAKRTQSLKSIIPSAWGVSLCKGLTHQRIGEWNAPFLVELGVSEREIVPGLPHQIDVFIDRHKKSLCDQKRPASLFDLLYPVFPQGVLNNRVTAVLETYRKGRYLFKVSLSGGLWCKMAFSDRHTLMDLHLMIQTSFSFDFDHLFAFFMDGKRYSKHAYYAPDCDGGPFVNEVTIGELGLYTGQQILYLFDFGDEWKFDVILLSIEPDEPTLHRPMLVESKGEPPQQYTEYDDF